MLERFEDHKFCKNEHTNTYHIDYYGSSLNLMERFCEGTFTLAKRIKVRRFYKVSSGDGGLPLFVTEVRDIA